MSDYLKVSEVADELRVSQLAVRQWIKAGRLRADRLGDGPNARVRIPRAALEEFVQPAGRQMTTTLYKTQADKRGMSARLRP